MKLSEKELKDIVQLGSITKESSRLSFLDEATKTIAISSIECSEDANLNLGSNESRAKVVFKTCTFHKNFAISNYSNILHLEFNDCQFFGDFKIENWLRDVKIGNNCMFYRNSSITLNDFKTLEITCSNFTSLELFGSYQKLYIDKINKTNIQKDSKLLLYNTLLRHSEFRDINFDEIEFLGHAKFLHEGNFYLLKCKKLTLNHINIDHLIHLRTCEIEKLFLDNIGSSQPQAPHRFLKLSEDCKIDNLSFPLHMFENTDIDKCQIVDFNIWGINSPPSVFKISNKCRFNKLKFTDVQNRSTIALRNISLNKDNTIAFINSDMGITDFIRCDFSKAKLEFHDSKIFHAFFSETDFPKKVNLGYKDRFKQARLIFGQLQTAFYKQGDSVRAIEYHSREIETHFFDICKSPTNILTTMNLALNMVSNNFGRWWGLGVVFTFLTGLFSFSMIIHYTDQYSFSLNINWSLLEPFLRFMNPLRSFDVDKLFDKETIVTSSSKAYYVWDLIGRIIIAYGYYQTIQAFRRYGKK